MAQFILAATLLAAGLFARERLNDDGLLPPALIIAACAVALARPDRWYW